jgi:hypothetical protein
VATLLADPPAAPSGGTPAAPTAGEAPPAAPGPAPSARTCAKCGGAMAPDQDWCLECGAGTPDSLSAHAPGWRSGAAVLAAVALLIAAAATAAYAALSKSSPVRRPVTGLVAGAPAAAAPAPVAPAPGAAPRAPKIGAPTTIKPLTPLKPPKIPLTASIPKIPTTVAPLPSSTGAKPVAPLHRTSSTPSPPAPTATAPSAGESEPNAILLDTNAASTYNPYNYPASDFGDPTLAIDGDTTTGWTALVNPAVAPKMAEGVVIDLNTRRKLSALTLTSSTPGMTIQVYGAKGTAPPASITDPSWAPLSGFLVAAKRHVRITLRQPTKSFRFVTLWISKAPASAVGTAQSPGHVSVNEIELFPAGG